MNTKSTRKENINNKGCGAVSIDKLLERPYQKGVPVGSSDRLFSLYASGWGFDEECVFEAGKGKGYKMGVVFTADARIVAPSRAVYRPSAVHSEGFSEGLKINGYKYITLNNVAAVAVSVTNTCTVTKIVKFEISSPEYDGISIAVNNMSVELTAGKTATFKAGMTFASNRKKLDEFFADENFLATQQREFIGWFERNIPQFECSDTNLTRIYYFRWLVFRNHIRLTPDGYIITEFLPTVPWAGKFNSISCSAAHHIYEGRWIKTAEYINDYQKFWTSGNSDPRSYSFAMADAYYARYTVSGDKDFLCRLLPDLIKNYQAWESSNYDAAKGLFWQLADRDGMEYGIGGDGYRPTINSYMYGDAVAIQKIAGLAGKCVIVKEYGCKAEKLRNNCIDKLWNRKDGFFEVLPVKFKKENLPDWQEFAPDETVGVRELIGYIPWCFNLPPDNAGLSQAFSHLLDSGGFYAPYGPCTAERRQPLFMRTNDHDCLWNGPSWPYATCQTAVAAANLLNNYNQKYFSKKDYFNLIKTYADSHFKDGHSWIAENLDPDTGKWIADFERSPNYNHSSFADLIITGIAGLRPDDNDCEVVVNPLFEPDNLDYFAVRNILYRGHNMDIVYNKDEGLKVYVDGKINALSPVAQKIIVPLKTNQKNIQRTKAVAPQFSDRYKADLTYAPCEWEKFGNAPVIGNWQTGTCFDPYIIKAHDGYRMYFSWRTTDSLAVCLSQDGIKFDSPRVILSPLPDSAYQKKVNRNCVVKKDGKFYMWYTGQNETLNSRIFFAESTDGYNWKRYGKLPVLEPEPDKYIWDKDSVMNPCVLWNEEKGFFEMWYSAGENYEPDVIAYAQSYDGIKWIKHSCPVFTPDNRNYYEQAKIGGCQIIKQDGWYCIFYIGYENVDTARICTARSRDGISGWQKYSGNPIVSPSQCGWDASAVYKPAVIYMDKTDKWHLYYNGRRYHDYELIGLVIREGKNLWK